MRRFTSFVLLLVFAAFVVWLVRDSIAMIQLILQDPPLGLPVPVAGVSSKQLQDTWGAPRSEGRRHQGIDIFAPRGTPVFSVTSGFIRKLGQNRLGGNIVWILGPGGQLHYYAHLERFAAIQNKDRVSVGDIIGYVGTSGNARGTPPHLHYGIYNLIGQPINPFPLLAPEKTVWAKGKSPSVFWFVLLLTARSSNHPLRKAPQSRLASRSLFARIVNGVRFLSVFLRR